MGLVGISLVGCGGGNGEKLGERVIPLGQPVPKGGGRYVTGAAYKVDGVFSEPYPSHAAALAAAQRAAAEQTVPGHTETIEYEDEKGRWHTETARGSDRPQTQIKDRT